MELTEQEYKQVLLEVAKGTIEDVLIHRAQANRRDIIRDRKDLRMAPHHWRMPMPIRVKVVKYDR